MNESLSPTFSRKFEIPDVKKIPGEKRLLRELGIHPSFWKDFEQKRAQFEDAEQVIAFLNAFGLGDSIMELRHVRAMAERCPKKAFLAYIPQSLFDIPYFDFPPNLRPEFKLEAPTLSEKLQDKKSFLLTLHGELSVEAALAILLSQTFFESVDLLKNGDLSTFSVAVFLKKVQANVYKWLKDNEPINSFDFTTAIAFKTLGVEIEKKDLARPLLKIDKEVIKKHPKKFDVLLAPDALEGLSLDETRSIKSISAEKWELIFRRFPPGTRLGVVLGHSHREYCEAVAEAAQKCGLQVELVVTATLTDFCHRVLECGMFVGMDSGTTHLASEVVKAAEVSGLRIQIKEIFNAEFMSAPYFAIRGHSQSQDVLNYRSESQLRVPQTVSDAQRKRYLEDIDHISPDEVVNFLFGEEESRATPRQMVAKFLRRVFRAHSKV